MTGLAAHFRLARKDFSIDARFEAPETGVTGLFGPSGSGKTTILRMIAGLEKPDKGWLSLNERIWQDEGRFMKPHRRPVGYVFQDSRLFPHLDVAGNLDFAIRRAGPAETPQHRDEVIGMFGLDRLMEHRPATLSGGERQRVAMARALLSHPRLMLMDEPLASLDRQSRREILPYLESLAHRLSLPILYVSHDLAEIERFADHLVLMENGRVTAAGPLASLAADPNLPLARDAEAGAVVDAVIGSFDPVHDLSACHIGPHLVLLPGRLGGKGETRRLRVRAGDVSIALQRAENTSILNILPCEIVSLDESGPGQVLAVLRLEGTEIHLLSRITKRSREALALVSGLGVQAQIKGMSLIDPESKT